MHMTHEIIHHTLLQIRTCTVAHHKVGLTNMAEKVLLKKVEDRLNCSICLDTYTDPKLLQCFHEYCQKCLVKLVVRDQHGQLILTCPICRQVTPVPANGVAGLPPAFRINELLDIVEEHKKTATESLASPEMVESISASVAPHKVAICCPEHGKEVELYCETCGEPICWKCVIKSGRHRGCEYQELNEAFEKYRVEITASLEPMENQLTITKKALAQLDMRCGEISDQELAIEADVHKTFRQLREVLDVRETEVTGQLHRLTQRKLKGLAVQRDHMETIQARIGSCVGFMRESLETDNQAEVMMMKTAVVKQVKELTAQFPPDTLKPIAEANMAFSASADITAACHNYGQLYAPGSPDPSKCHVTSKGIEEAVVGETSTAIFQAIDFSGQPCEEPIESSECELVSEITGTRARGSIEKKGQSQYEFSYTPTIKGRHQLHVKMECQHIRGSPFHVVSRLPVEKLNTPILTVEGVGQPRGVAVNKRGEMIVTEWKTGRVSIFSRSGKKVRSFGNGLFNDPYGVAVDGDGNILVADRGNHRIQKFTAEGQFLTAVDTENTKHLQLRYPRGITTSNSNKVYVTANHCVQVLNSDLTFSSSFGKYGSGKGQFDSPCDIACDRTGKVYVADTDNHRIQVFTADGKFLSMFGRRGAGRGELYCPYGVAIDSSDMMYINELDNHRVSVFTTAGRFVTSFGSRGWQPGQFEYPGGIAVDDSGMVYVCDSDNNRLQVF